jgi:hypothetical protein
MRNEFAQPKIEPAGAPQGDPSSTSTVLKPPDLHQIRCREIERSDIDGVATLLSSGFPRLRRDFWLTALDCMTRHSTPPGYPKYGYVLECGDGLTGVILLIFSTVFSGGAPKIRCSVAAWYTDERFKSYAAMLASRALRHRNVTYSNITPDPHTVPILKAQGYVQYCSGLFVAVPPLFSRASRSKVDFATDATISTINLPDWEKGLLRDHRNYGRISVICTSEDGSYHPFVFILCRKLGLVRWAYLAYCRQVDDLVRLAGPVGRFLFRRGICLIAIDSNGPLAGVYGRYFGGLPKFYRGPDRPRLGDLGYSERAMFGF